MSILKVLHNLLKKLHNSHILFAFFRMDKLRLC